MDKVLTERQRTTLRRALDGRLVVLCFGAGVDSTGLMVALRAAGLRPDLVSMADVGDEKPGTWQHVERMSEVLRAWGWPPVTVCRKVPLAATGYSSLSRNCWKNETLPSLAFGLKSCSHKWKTVPQDQLLMGVSRGPNKRPPHPLWLQAQAQGRRIVKLIGYDCGRSDLRRSHKVPTSDRNFDYLHPLQLIGWHRQDCVRAIVQVLGPALVPIKSACFMCPASKVWELWWLAAEHPDLLEQALQLERRALTGKHSRFDAVEFGATWEDMVRNADSFPSSNTTVGLGRSFAWNQWARVNKVVDTDFRVRRNMRATFLATAEGLREADNALDARSGSAAASVPLAAAERISGRSSAVLLG
jgi:hypothetical protein